VRVIVFHAYPHQYAGAQRFTHGLARALPDRGCWARVVTPADGPFVARLRDDGIDVRIVPAPEVWQRYGRALEGPLAGPALASLPAYWLKLARAIKGWRPSVVHCNDHRGLLLGGPAARLAAVPVVWHVHGVYPSLMLNLLGMLVAERILVNSRATLAGLPVLKRSSGKVEVLYCGVPPWRSLSDQGGATPILHNGRPAIVCGARLHPDKGIDVLIRATAIVRQSFPDVQVYIAGGEQQGYEHYRRELERLRIALGLGQAVHFLGPLENTTATWAAATLYVQPSRAEPLGLGVLEAMSLGVPVITSRVGGLTEVVEDGVSGLQVEPDDPAALAAAIGRLLADPLYARAVALAGQARTERSFSHDEMVGRLLEIYREATA